MSQELACGELTICFISDSEIKSSFELIFISSGVAMYDRPLRFNDIHVILYYYDTINNRFQASNSVQGYGGPL